MSWKLFDKNGAQKVAPASVVNPTARIYQGAGGTQALPSATFTAPTLPTTDFATASGMTATANGLTATSAGKYLAIANASFGGGTPAMAEVNWYVNGVLVQSGNTPGASSANGLAPTVSTVMSLNAGDFVQAKWYQTAAAGITFYTADLSLTKIDGAVVSYVGVPGSLIGQELAYVEATAAQTISATTEATSSSVVAAPALTFDGSTKIRVEFFCPSITCPTAAAGRVRFTLWDGIVGSGTDLGIFQDVGTDAAGNALTGAVAVREFIPSAGSHTFAVGAYRITANMSLNMGTGGAANYLPGYIRITRAA